MMSKPIVDVTRGTGLVDPVVVNPGPVAPVSGSPGQPPNPGPSENPSPHVLPPVPGTPRPGDPPPAPTNPTPQPSTTQPPTPSPPHPTI
ncbi:MAG: hypothetical protein ACRELG_19900, partial [Gemmataceae bacterium]